MMRTTRTLLLGTILTASAYSQSPPPGDPGVFFAYLRHAHQEVSDISQRRSTAEASAVRLGAQVGDLPALEAVYQSTATSLAALKRETKNYVDDTIQKGQKPARAKLEEIYARRIQALQKARNSLQQGLGPSRWARIEGHIEGEFRSRIKRRALPWPDVQ